MYFFSFFCNLNTLSHIPVLYIPPFLPTSVNVYLLSVYRVSYWVSLVLLVFCGNFDTFCEQLIAIVVKRSKVRSLAILSPYSEESVWFGKYCKLVRGSVCWLLPSTAPRSVNSRLIQIKKCVLLFVIDGVRMFEACMCTFRMAVERIGTKRRTRL